MITLADTDYLAFKLGGAITTAEMSAAASWSLTDLGSVPQGAIAYSSGASEVTLVPSPATGKTAVVKSVAIHNRDTVAQTLTVWIVRNEGAATLWSASLPVGVSLIYSGDGGWRTTQEDNGLSTHASLSTTAHGGIVPNTRTITAGTGLTGGGSLAADRTLAVSYGTTAGTACEGNDSRLADSRTPVSHASSHNAGGGDALAIDAVAGTGSLRTLGTSSTSACSGADSRLSDARTPVSHASSHNAGGGDALAIDSVAGTGSLRTLGTSSTSACAGNDSRLSDARTPTSHASGHLYGGSDPVGHAPLNGFINRTDSTLGMSGSNFQITTATSYSFYSAGTKYTKTTTQQVAIATDLATHYVYFDTAGTLQVSTSAWDITSDNVPVALVYKDGSTYAVNEERHGWQRDRHWHKWAHLSIGARYISGFAGTFTDTTLSVAQGVVADEDIFYDTASTRTACRLWYRNSGLTAMRFEANISTPFKSNAGALQYDNAGTLADATANRYVCQYVYATDDIDYPVQVVVGQAQHTTLNAARAESLPSILLPTLEWKLLYRLIYQQAAGVADYIEATDYRLVSQGPSGASTSNDHQALINRDTLGAHPESAIAFTDITTGNASSSAHGYQAKLPASNGASSYQRGDGTWVNGQIQFPATANPSSDANCMDDYEEGTFTATASFTSGQTGSFTYNAGEQAGNYTKIGDRVFFDITIGWSAIPSAGNQLILSGLPFASNSTTASMVGPVNATVTTGSWNTATPDSCLIFANSSSIYVLRNTTTSRANYNQADIPSSMTMVLSGTYRV